MNYFLIVLSATLAQQASTSADLRNYEYFESRIRPVLVKHCYECHSTNSQEVSGGLLVDSAAGIRAGGDSGQVVLPGDPEASILIEALKYDGLEMPPAGRLDDQIISDFEKWVQLGAPDPRSQTPTRRGQTEIDVEAGKQFWAFQPIERQAPPPVSDAGWVRNEIDTFVLARLESAGLGPADDAGQRTLLRRLFFDLTGLPPTAEQLEQFIGDDRPDALEIWVDSLLESPQFGVHWGRHWLDVVRYADSNGGDFNATFHNAWRYRNYVVDAFNNDKKYNHFIMEQIAGDLLPYSSDSQRTEQIIATGFLMIGTKMLSERDKGKLRMDVVDEQVDTVGTAFLGMTIGCARCHDHKFDPIPSRDYYALAGIFRSTRTLQGESQKYVSTWPRRPLPTTKGHAANVAEHERATKELKAKLSAAQKELARIDAVRSQAGSTVANATSREVVINGQRLTVESLRRRKKELELEVTGLSEQEKLLSENAPPPLPNAIAVAEFSEIADCHICIRGEHENLGELIPRGFLQVATTGTPPEISADESGRRQLAEWIADPRHPLTGRVIVNRAWSYLLGEGIVRTVDNLGELGERPTHPQLLDYLASRFVTDSRDENGFDWSLKKLIREIVLSRTYAMSSKVTDEAWQIDPENRLLGRANRRRLPAESIRDAMLAVSGQLVLSPTGSPVEGLGVLVTTNNADATEYNQTESHFRSLYLPIIRNELPPLLRVFDFADPDLVTGKRPVTNVPAQALLLLNSSFVMESAERTAERILVADFATSAALVDRLYREILSRPPTLAEVARATQFLESGNVGSRPNPAKTAQLVQVLFAATEFRMLD